MLPLFSYFLRNHPIDFTGKYVVYKKVPEGTFTYRIVELTIEEVLLSLKQSGIIELTVKHELLRWK